MLVLNGTGQGVINNLSVPSLVQPGYAPAGEHLLSVSVVQPELDEATLWDRVAAELRQWFGAGLGDLRPLKQVRIEHALPAQPPAWLDPPERPARLSEGLYVCGDHRLNASIHGAMLSGRHAAEAVLADGHYRHRRPTT
jgi:phytoene dehydrogenase-like protein